MGRHLLKQWLHRPTLEMHVLVARHQAIAFFAQIDVADMVQEIKKCLKHVGNIAGLLAKIRDQCATTNEWRQLLLASITLNH